MTYREFLRLAKSTRKECPSKVYDKIIEPAYMKYDLLFPDKEAVVDHWRRFGLMGFSPVTLDFMYEAALRIRRVLDLAGSPSDGLAGLADFIVKAANDSLRTLKGKK